MSHSFIAAASVRAADAEEAATVTADMQEATELGSVVWQRLPSAGTVRMAFGTAASVAASTAGGTLSGGASGAVNGFRTGYSIAGIAGAAVGGTGGAVMGASSGAAISATSAVASSVVGVAASCAAGAAASTAYAAGGAVYSCAAYLADKTEDEYRFGDVTRRVLGKLSAKVAEYSSAPDDASHARITTTLLDLPDEVMEIVGHAALINCARDALCFCQASQTLQAKLKWLQDMVEARRLRWMPELSAFHEISENGRTLTVVHGSDERIGTEVKTHGAPWATGGLLPTQGQSTWTVRVIRSKENDGNGMWVGVCDEFASWAWGLFLYSGRLRRISRDAHGRINFDATPLEGYPNGNYKQIMMDTSGQPKSLRGQANGSLIEVLVDHDAGTLAYRVDGGARFEALPPNEADTSRRFPPGASSKTDTSRRFPPGAALRPYAACYYLGDCLRFDACACTCTHRSGPTQTNDGAAGRERG